MAGVRVWARDQKTTLKSSTRILRGKLWTDDRLLVSSQRERRDIKPTPNKLYRLLARVGGELKIHGSAVGRNAGILCDVREIEPANALDDDREDMPPLAIEREKLLFDIRADLPVLREMGTASG